MSGSSSNEEQIKYWNEEAGPKWVELQERLDAQIGPIGEAMLGIAAPQSGEDVLDVGCGCGELSLSVARQVGGSGSVTGVDISAPMLARARERAAAAGLSNASFVEGDAQTHSFAPESLDLITSRFGVMFFDDPPAAFANLRKALRPEGRVCFVCWQGLGENPWMSVPVMAAIPHLPAPPAPPPPDAPGPFAFADRDRVRKIFSEAGYGGLEIEPLAGELSVGGPLELGETADFVLRMGPTARLLADADDALVARVKESVREALVPYQGDTGIRMSYACWVVSARHS